MNSKTLRELLEDWNDLDNALFSLAICLGIMLPDTNFQVKAKHVFWSNHPVGTMLHETLLRLVDLGVLEHREKEDDEYRWNPAFKGSWE